MALFGSHKKTAEKEAKKPSTVKKVDKKPAKRVKGKKAAPAKTVAAGKKTIFTEKVLLRPHVTEKAAQLTAKNVYTFEISSRANKKGVVDAVKAVYGVTPIKVATVNIPAKRVRLRKKRGFGTRAATKKAYVYLKEGDRIDFST